MSSLLNLNCRESNLSGEKIGQTQTSGVKDKRNMESIKKTKHIYTIEFGKYINFNKLYKMYSVFFPKFDVTYLQFIHIKMHETGSMLISIENCSLFCEESFFLSKSILPVFYNLLIDNFLKMSSIITQHDIHFSHHKDTKEELLLIYLMFALSNLVSENAPSRYKQVLKILLSSKQYSQTLFLLKKNVLENNVDLMTFMFASDYLLCHMNCELVKLKSLTNKRLIEIKNTGVREHCFIQNKRKTPGLYTLRCEYQKTDFFRGPELIFQNSKLFLAKYTYLKPEVSSKLVWSKIKYALKGELYLTETVIEIMEENPKLFENYTSSYSLESLEVCDFDF